MFLLPILSRASEIVWGVPLLVLLVGTGVDLTIRLGGLQFRTLGSSSRAARPATSRTSRR